MSEKGCTAFRFGIEAHKIGGDNKHVSDPLSFRNLEYGLIKIVGTARIHLIHFWKEGSFYINLFIL